MRRFLHKTEDFLLAPVPAGRLTPFRICMGLVMVYSFVTLWMNAAEWLTDEGFHLPPAAALPYFAFQFRALPAEFLPVFGVVFFGAMAAFILGWKVQVAAAICLACNIYVYYLDRATVFTINKLFIATLITFLLFKPDKKTQTICAFPLRALQATLLIMYFGNAVSKAWYGDWLSEPNAMWSFANGRFRSDLTASLLAILPLWVWTFFQYSALVYEAFAPILFSVRRWRLLGVAGGIGLHLGIALLMHRLQFFGLQCVSFYVLFFDEKDLLTVKGYLQRVFSKSVPTRQLPVPQGLVMSSLERKS